MQMPCSNTQALSDYMFHQDTLEKDWEMDLPNKQEAVIAYAKKIMEGLVGSEEFLWVFAEYYEDSDFDVNIYVDGFDEALDNWNLGQTPSCELEYEMLWKICHSALSGASELLYDTEFEELFDNLGKTIKEVIAND